MNPDTPDAKEKEEFELGSVAVVNYDGEKGQSESETVPTKKANKIGAFIVAKTDEKLIEPGENLVVVVRKHPIGLIGIYAEMLTGILLIIGMVAAAIFGFLTSSSGQTQGLVGAIGLFIVGFLVLVFLISIHVYRQCRLLVTDKAVVQILQRSLFNRKVSRLSMSNVEDVNVEQKGILPSMFGYGTLTIQTAGEVDNFVFPMCPSPDTYANRILQARQSYVRSYGEGDD